jgi:hypothetical protein
LDSHEAGTNRLMRGLPYSFELGGLEVPDYDGVDYEGKNGNIYIISEHITHIESQYDQLVSPLRQCHESLRPFFLDPKNHQG